MSEETNQPHFSMQKIYLKKNLFTSPNSAGVFGTDWKPETTLDLNITNTAIDSDGRYEVIITVKVTATNENIVALSLNTSDAADDLLCVDPGGPRILKKKKNKNTTN